jgi:hypothetical protein
VYAGVKQAFEGRRVNFQDLVDQEGLVIRDYKMLPSKYKAEGGSKRSMAVVLADYRAEAVTFSTGSEVIIQQLDRIKGQLPVTARITKPPGKNYFSLA